MENKSLPCVDCKMRRKYDNNPKSLIARFWHWHTSFCPGWKTYLQSLSPDEQVAMAERYHLKIMDRI